jgi:hypothetical protein
MKIKKIALGGSPPPYYQKVVTRAKEVGLEPDLIRMFDRIVWDVAPPPGNPNAIAYVSSEDKDDNGKIDSIHFVLSKFPQNITDDEIDHMVKLIAETLTHELAHIRDYDPEKNEFPGGESVAEQAQRAAVPGLETKLNLKQSAHRGVGIVKDIVKLADHLDEVGESKVADRLDAILKEISDLGVFDEGKLDEDKLKDNYMAESHAKNIRENSDSIITQLDEDPDDIDDWMRTYLAQSDLMIDAVDKALRHRGDTDSDFDGKDEGAQEKLSHLFLGSRRGLIAR